jgi:hypothetical protein
MGQNTSFAKSGSPSRMMEAALRTDYGKELMTASCQEP